MIDQHNFDIQCLHDSRMIDGAFKSRGIERRRHLHQVMPYAELTGHVMEFGVYSGKTLYHISGHWSDQTCWGFDSFEGLPEQWIINVNQGAVTTEYGAGHFHLRGYKPEFRSNVKLVKGWFKDTIPSWLEQNPGDICFLHIDCDLYSSTRDILWTLNDRIRPGTVIAFDEMYPWEESPPYTQWYEHEYLALKEWLGEFNRAFEPLFRNRNQQCSIRIVR